MPAWKPLRTIICTLVVSRSGWKSAPGVPCTQWSGHSVCGPQGNCAGVKGSASRQLLANEAWPGGCQSCVSTIWSWRPIRRLTSGTIARAPGTARAPPSQKAFCMSTTINASFGITHAPSQWRYVSAALFFLECCDPGIERTAFDGAPEAAHDVLVVLQIVPRQKHRRENLLGAKQMMQIGAAVMAAGGTRALLVDRPVIVAMAGVAQIELTAARKSLRRAAATRRQHAVEHVDAAFHGADDISRPSHAHQVARPVGGQHGRCHIKDTEHGLLAFADGQPAHGIAVEAAAGQRLAGSG